MPRIEVQLKILYTAAYREIRKQLLEIMGRFEFDGEMTPAERLIEANKFNRLDKLIDLATQALTAANRQAMGAVNDRFRSEYAARYNQVVAQMKASTDDEEFLAILAAIPFMTLKKGDKITSRVKDAHRDRAMDNIKDRAVVKATMTQQITNGILTGLAASAIIGSIRDFVNGDLNRAVRIGVTELGKVDSQAVQDAGDRAQDSGLYIVKRWSSVMDTRTRTINENDAFEHLEADGMLVPLDEPFMIPTKDGGVEALMQPREGGSPGNTINCRCGSQTRAVTKAQYDYVVEQYAAGNYFPDIEGIESQREEDIAEVEKERAEKEAQRQAEIAERKAKRKAERERYEEFRKRELAKTREYEKGLRRGK